jgi:hypothetical protein
LESYTCHDKDGNNEHFIIKNKAISSGYYSGSEFYDFFVRWRWGD